MFFKGNKRYENVLPKCELLTTHSGRKTFICNAIRLGIPTNVIMEWTGHSDYKAMKPYIKIVDAVKEENMSKFDTFPKKEEAIVKNRKPEKVPENGFTIWVRSYSINSVNPEYSAI